MPDKRSENVILERRMERRYQRVDERNRMRENREREREREKQREREVEREAGYSYLQRGRRMFRSVAAERGCPR